MIVYYLPVQSQRSRTMTIAPLHLTIRTPKIDLETIQIDLDWIPEDAFLSQLMNSFSLTFPIGEKYFIDSVNGAIPFLNDPLLIAEVRKFMAQESIHTRLHRKMNNRLFENGLRFGIEGLLLRRVRLSQTFDIRSQVAITMAYEHFTATLGDMLATQSDLLNGAAENLRLLWTWHAMEECEHRALASDVYRALGGKYGRRVGWFIYISLVFQIDITIQTLDNLYRSGNLFKLKTWRCAARFLLRRGGLLRWIVPAWFAYFRPGFDPRDRGDATAAAGWLRDHADLFAEPASAAARPARP